MSDMGDMWRDAREASKKKKANNLDNSIKILESEGFEIRQCSNEHFKIGDWDFWPTTGKFYNAKTGIKGRGVFNLIKKLKQQYSEMKDG